jgi:hypothetical protein
MYLTCGTSGFGNLGASVWKESIDVFTKTKRRMYFILIVLIDLMVPQRVKIHKNKELFF